MENPTSRYRGRRFYAMSLCSEEGSACPQGRTMPNPRTIFSRSSVGKGLLLFSSKLSSLLMRMRTPTATAAAPLPMHSHWLRLARSTRALELHVTGCRLRTRSIDVSRTVLTPRAELFTTTHPLVPEPIWMYPHGLILSTTRWRQQAQLRCVTNRGSRALSDLIEYAHGEFPLNSRAGGGCKN